MGAATRTPADAGSAGAVVEPLRPVRSGARTRPRWRHGRWAGDKAPRERVVSATPFRPEALFDFGECRTPSRHHYLHAAQVVTKRQNRTPAVVAKS